MLKEIKEFKLTNGIFYDICLAREKFNITRDTLSQFIMEKLNCSGVFTVIVSKFYNLKKKVQKLSIARKLAEKENFISKPFLPSQPKIGFETETARNNPQTFSRETDETEDSELSLLGSSFSDLAQSILLNGILHMMKLKLKM